MHETIPMNFEKNIKEKNKGDRVNTRTSLNIIDCYAEQTQIKEHDN